MVIFRICLLKPANDPVVCKQRPFGVKTTITFIVDQASSNTKHPYDFDADDSMGAAKKKGIRKILQVERDKGNDNIISSSEITPKYNSAGGVVGGTYQSRNHSTWVTNICSSKSVYALILQRAEDKRLQEKEILFVKWITFIMPI